MNRKSFLKSIFAAIAFSPVVARLVEEISVQVPEDQPQMLEVNPEWESAPYEVSYVFHPGAFEHLVDPSPIRYKIQDGEWVQVSRWIST